MAISSSSSSFLVLGRDCGRTRRVLTLGFLILGGPWPIVVDTGYRSNQIMETLGMRGLQFHENMIENQLARHGVRMGDVRFVMHTHLHIDHAGKDDLFPLNTTVVAQPARARIFGVRSDASAISGARHQASDRPAPHQERAAVSRSRAVGSDRDLPGGLLRGGQRSHRRIDERARAHRRGRRHHLRRRDLRFQRSDRRAVPDHPGVRAAGHRQSRHQQAPGEGGAQRSCSAMRASCCRCTTGRRRSTAARWWRGCRTRCRARSPSHCRGAAGSRPDRRSWSKSR